MRLVAARRLPGAARSCSDSAAPAVGPAVHRAAAAIPPLTCHRRPFHVAVRSGGPRRISDGVGLLPDYWSPLVIRVAYQVGNMYPCLRIRLTAPLAGCRWVL